MAVYVATSIACFTHIDTHNSALHFSLAYVSDSFVVFYHDVEYVTVVSLNGTVSVLLYTHFDR